MREFLGWLLMTAIIVGLTSFLLSAAILNFDQHDEVDQRLDALEQEVGDE